MKNWIMNFIADERGAESTELAITGVVVAGGAVTGFSALKTKIDEKQDELITKIGAADSST
jgi:Flp pilus assembly pilin Flp